MLGQRGLGLLEIRESLPDEEGDIFRFDAIGAQFVSQPPNLTGHCYAQRTLDETVIAVVDQSRSRGAEPLLTERLQPQPGPEPGFALVWLVANHIDPACVTSDATG